MVYFTFRAQYASHPSRGAWIEMRCLWSDCACVPRRTPHGVRGLKSRCGSLARMCVVSHPSRGAWIEILILTCRTGLPCRTPHGVRGLKYCRWCIMPRARKSHPSRGAWIEITVFAPNAFRLSGRTPHGVRGLKYGIGEARCRHDSRTPHGVRGLKSWLSVALHCKATSHPSRGAWIEIKRLHIWFIVVYVAPLTGCVD